LSKKKKKKKNIMIVKNNNIYFLNILYFLNYTKIKKKFWIKLNVSCFRIKFFMLNNRIVNYNGKYFIPLIINTMMLNYISNSLFFTRAIDIKNKNKKAIDIKNKNKKAIDIKNKKAIDIKNKIKKKKSKIMGHLVNPITYRLSKSQFWISSWNCITKKNYKNLFLEDYNLIKFLEWLKIVINWKKLNIDLVSYNITKTFKLLFINILFINDNMYPYLSKQKKSKI